MYGAYGVLAALHERSSAPGAGTVVRTSLLAAVVGVHAFQGTRWTVAGEVGRAQGNHHPSIAPYGLFHCRDGAVQIAVGSEGLWRRFCDGLRDRPGDAEGWRPTASGSPRRERVIEVVEAAFADWDAEPLLARLAEVGVPGRQGAHPRRGLRVGPGRAARGCWSTSTTRRSATITLPGPPLRFFDAAGDEVTRARPRRAAAARPARRRRSAPGSAGAARDAPPSTRWTAARAARPGARRGHLRSRGTGRSTSPAVEPGYRAAARGRRAQGRHRRVGAHRSRRGPRPAGGGGGQRVRASSPARSGGPRPTGSPPPYAARPPRACPLLATHVVGRHPHAGGHARLRRMVEISRALDGPPGRRPALPRAPAPPHDRRRLRLVGLARPRHRRRARRAGRLPRAQGLRGAQRPAVPGRACRRRRTSPPRASSTRVVARRGPARRWSTAPLARARRPARARPSLAAPATPVGDHAAWEVVERTRRTDRAGVRDLLAVRRHRHAPPARHRRGRARLDACWSP